MTLDIERLRKRTGAGTGANALLTEALDDAKDMVSDYVAKCGKVVGTDVSAAVFERAVLRCAVALYNQDTAPKGVVNEQYDLGNGEIASAPAQIGIDPMKSARAFLASVGIAPVGAA
jgi:hypothetical protein